MRETKWDEHSGMVSRSFELWKRTDAENRAFLRLSSKWSAAGYTREWADAEESFSKVFDPDQHFGDEHIDMFEDAVDGLWPDSYEWMAEAAALKNCVTAFEVYLEKSLYEILNRWQANKDGETGKLRLNVQKGFQSPSWGILASSHRIIGNNITGEESPVAPAVDQARKLRHFLTHQNGEFTTEVECVMSGVVRAGWPVTVRLG